MNNTQRMINTGKTKTELKRQEPKKELDPDRVAFLERLFGKGIRQHEEKKD